MNIYPDADPLDAALIQEIEEYVDDGKKLRALLESGANPNATPTLYMAVSCRLELDIVRLLLDYGADPRREGNSSQDAIVSAAWGGLTGIVRLLLEHGADPDYKSDGGDTALMGAARQGDVDTVRVLLDHGADVDLYGGCGHGPDVAGCGAPDFSTPLNAAALGFHVEVVRVLIDHGADVNSVGVDYRSTVLDQFHRQSISNWFSSLPLPRLRRREQVLDMLVRAGAVSHFDPARRP